MKISPKVLEAAKKIKLIAMDVDGVLTGGEIIILDSSEEIKIWNVKDRMAFSLLRTSEAGIKTAWITGRESNQVSARAKEIGVNYLYQNCMVKKAAFQEILKNLNLTADQAVYIGDDVIDISVLRMAGLSVCPADAQQEVKDEVLYISSLPGGKGVFRELVDIVLKAQGFWDKAVEEYL